MIANNLYTVEQAHESEVQLLMTMKQCQPRIVRHKIHFHFLVTANSQNLNRGRNLMLTPPDGVGAPVAYTVLPSLENA